jgi:YD repeat-containing protein
MVYDALGDLTSTTDPLGRVTSSTFDEFGEATESFDPAGNHSFDVYNADGEVTIAVTGVPASNSSLVTTLISTTGTWDVTDSNYDADGNLTETFDKPWKAQRKIKLGSGHSNEPGVADITFTYHGTRSNADRPTEAVVFLKGTVRGKEGGDQAVGGTLSGTAVFDLKNKQVKYTDVTMNLDLDLPTRGGGSLQANGALKIVLNRVPKDQAKTK